MLFAIYQKFKLKFIIHILRYLILEFRNPKNDKGLIKRPELSTNEIVISSLGWLYWADLCTVSNA